jgi:hypothetical protein
MVVELFYCRQEALIYRVASQQMVKTDRVVAGYAQVVLVVVLAVLVVLVVQY